MSIPAIVLAAGASQRLGQPKQLVEFEGETLLNRTIRMAREAGADPVLVVLGARFAEICATLPLEDVVLAFNDEWQSGMASSIRAGLRALTACDPQAEAVLLLTCDQPRLTVDHLRGLFAASAQHPGRIAASRYRGTRGTPAIFPRALFPPLSNLHGDRGARSLLLHPSCDVVEIDFPGGEVDIDTPADLHSLNQPR